MDTTRSAEVHHLRLARRQPQLPGAVVVHVGLLTHWPPSDEGGLP